MSSHTVVKDICVVLTTQKGLTYNLDLDSQLHGNNILVKLCMFTPKTSFVCFSYGTMSRGLPPNYVPSTLFLFVCLKLYLKVSLSHQVLKLDFTCSPTASTSWDCWDYNAWFLFTHRLYQQGRGAKTLSVPHIECRLPILRCSPQTLNSSIRPEVNHKL